MISVGYLRCVTVVAIMLSLGAVTGSASDVSLQISAVVVDPAETPYVLYTISELRRQVKAVADEEPALYYDLKDVAGKQGAVVVVGRAMAKRLMGQQSGVPAITDSDPGEQGFVLKAIQNDGRNFIVAAGSDSHGTNYALMQLRQLLI